MAAAWAFEAGGELFTLDAPFARMFQGKRRITFRADTRHYDRNLEALQRRSVASPEILLEHDDAAFERGDAPVFEIPQQIVEEGDGLCGLLGGRPGAPSLPSRSASCTTRHAALQGNASLYSARRASSTESMSPRCRPDALSICSAMAAACSSSGTSSLW